jgi:hypothetical protein
MRRIQFIELHEQPWFPGLLRDDVTDELQYGMSLFNAYAPVAPLIQSLVDATATPSIVDVCSGGGGPWLELSRSIQTDGGALRISLTDKYPNLRALECLSGASRGRIKFRCDSVDAMKVPADLAGIRTIFSSFHHFPPHEAATVLGDAVAARRGVGIFEITTRAPWAVALMFPWALLAFLYTPMIRPFRWSRLFWTYLFPVIPIVLLFDGVVSCLRSYRPSELLEIAQALAGPEYNWEAGELSGAAGMPITYLIGFLAARP